MKFKELDTVRILKNHGNNINIGDIGVVVMVFDNPNEAYEVEIIDNNGITKEQCTFLPCELELINDK